MDDNDQVSKTKSDYTLGYKRRGQLVAHFKVLNQCSHKYVVAGICTRKPLTDSWGQCCQQQHMKARTACGVASTTPGAGFASPVAMFLHVTPGTHLRLSLPRRGPGSVQMFAVTIGHELESNSGRAVRSALRHRSLHAHTHTLSWNELDRPTIPVTNFTKACGLSTPPSASDACDTSFSNGAYRSLWGDGATKSNNYLGGITARAGGWNQL